MAGRDHDEPASQTGTFGPFSGNDRTLAAFSPNEAELSAPGAREAFLLAYDRLAELASAARRPSFVVGAVDDRSRLVDAVLLEAGSALTIGRHTKCRLRLPSQAISLRHMVALARLDESGTPALHVWDLNTRLPFRTEDGEAAGAVVSDGSTYLSLGPFALWFLPCGVSAPWPSRGAEAYRAMPSRSFVDRRSPAERRAGAPALPPPKMRGGPYRGFGEFTRVTTHAAPLLLGDDEEPEVAWGTLRMQSGNAKAKRRISAERLEQGLLVGRYERCGLSIGQIDRNVSRVHMLLVRIGPEVWAIDTGSTNGVRLNGKSIDAETLGETARLEFGSGMTLDWTRLSHPEA